MPSTLSKMDRTSLTFSCNTLSVEGLSVRICMAFEAPTARSGGIEAENMNAVPLMRYAMR